MKERIISIALSLIILMTGQVIGVSTHYCMGKPVKSGLIFGQKVAECSMMTNENVSPLLDSNKCQFAQENCCKNISSTLKVENVSIDVIHHIKLENNLSIALISFFVTKEAFDRYNKIVVPKIPNFHFPSLDLQAFYQIFLI